MRLKRCSLRGSAREELEKGERQVKKTGCESEKRNNADSSDDKIGLTSKWVEVLSTARSPSKCLCIPAWRRVHWIWFIRQESILSSCVEWKWLVTMKDFFHIRYARVRAPCHAWSGKSVFSDRFHYTCLFDYTLMCGFFCFFDWYDSKRHVGIPPLLMIILSWNEIR